MPFPSTADNNAADGAWTAERAAPSAAARTNPPATPAPRLAPATGAEMGLVNSIIARVIGAGTGGQAPNVFTTLARHRGLFRRWLVFASGLMPGGRLPRADTELLILRTAHNCRCEYEWHHHERIGRAAGLTPDQIAAVRSWPDAETDCLSGRRQLLLRAADELHEQRELSDESWRELRSLLSDNDLVELCLLVGHYEMLAMAISSLGVQPDAAPIAGTSPLMRIAQAILRRGGGWS